MKELVTDDKSCYKSNCTAPISVTIALHLCAQRREYFVYILYTVVYVTVVDQYISQDAIIDLFDPPPSSPVCPVSCPSSLSCHIYLETLSYVLPQLHLESTTQYNLDVGSPVTQWMLGHL